MFIDYIKRRIMNNFPFEMYYKFTSLFQKYYEQIIKPSFVFTVMVSLGYICFTFLFKWKIELIVIAVIFVIFILLFIIIGVLYGENQKEFYLKDD